jgi:hypothetical protein
MGWTIVKLWTGEIFGSGRVEHYVALVELFDALEAERLNISDLAKTSRGWNSDFE